MVVKQETKTCICGQAIEFPEGQIRFKCCCGSLWELTNEGSWFAKDISAYLITKKVRESCEKAIASFVRSFEPWFRKLAQCFRNVYECLVDVLAKDNINPRWFNLYKHGKKRVRKKYERKIRDRRLLLLTMETERRRRIKDAKTT